MTDLLIHNQRFSTPMPGGAITFELRLQDSTETPAEKNPNYVNITIEATSGGVRYVAVLCKKDVNGERTSAPFTEVTLPFGESFHIGRFLDEGSTLAGIPHLKLPGHHVSRSHAHLVVASGNSGKRGNTLSFTDTSSFGTHVTYNHTKLHLVETASAVHDFAAQLPALDQDFKVPFQRIAEGQVWNTTIERSGEVISVHVDQERLDPRTTDSLIKVELAAIKAQDSTLSEVGLRVLYRPGTPDESGLLAVYTQDRHPTLWLLSEENCTFITTPIHLLEQKGPGSLGL